eukprot:COSAG02_NODE_2927_length_7713_cov_98.281590_3_plen_86_part_00
MLMLHASAIVLHVQAATVLRKGADTRATAALPLLAVHRRRVATTRVGTASRRRNNGRVAGATGAMSLLAGATDRPLLLLRTVVTG